ncbi:hypothetical protein DFH09DRAFT_1272267 [Mycena vulgaris]|nr:hypothetical protein DFH09DRAFT_1272267 [Mycena vulgaris]
MRESNDNAQPTRADVRGGRRSSTGQAGDVANMLREVGGENEKSGRSLKVGGGCLNICTPCGCSAGGKLGIFPDTFSWLAAGIAWDQLPRIVPASWVLRIGGIAYTSLSSWQLEKKLHSSPGFLGRPDPNITSRNCDRKSQIDHLTATGQKFGLKRSGIRHPLSQCGALPPRAHQYEIMPWNGTRPTGNSGRCVRSQARGGEILDHNFDLLVNESKHWAENGRSLASVDRRTVILFADTNGHECGFSPGGFDLKSAVAVTIGPDLTTEQRTEVRKLATITKTPRAKRKK